MGVTSDSEGDNDIEETSVEQLLLADHDMIDDH